MKDIFFKIWKDPVWSKVISVGIIGLITLLWSQISERSFGYFIDKLNINVPVKLWLLLVLAIPVFSFAIKIIGKKPKQIPLIENESDVLAAVDSWWPKITGGYFPDDVKVNFKEIEVSHRLGTGSVKKVIDKVASKRNFKPKFIGDTYATYEYVHKKG